MLKKPDFYIAPVYLFPDLNWFLNYSGDGKNLLLSDEIESAKTFAANRCVLIGPNKISNFSVPLQKKSFDTRVSDLLISNQSKWLKEFKNTLQTIYGKTPYFEYYDYKLWNVLESQKDERFINFVLGVLEWAHKALQWDVNIQLIAAKPRLRTHHYEIQPYPQPFAHKFGFVQNAPIFDAIFCLGPEVSCIGNH
ncbi:MAG: WbqC family protein [Bacteroidetes bacterium]|nr:WbqC family protein [Bacteroidota bacterium]